MYKNILTTLELKNFRNYNKTTISFVPGINIIIGPNGVGKTNILEAITILSLGKSHRSGLEYESIQLGADHMQVKGFFEDKKIEVNYVKSEDSNRVKKAYKINNVDKSNLQFVGAIKTVNFGPEDIRLVAGSPGRRREHLDKMLKQVYPMYNANLNKYNRLLKHRNKLLEKLKGQLLQHAYETQMSVWNDQLIQSGTYLQDVRNEFFDFSNQNLYKLSKDLYKGLYNLKLNYFCNVINKDRLAMVRDAELRIGTTQIGPNRDDYEFILVDNGRNISLKSYGSRGQQRTGVLCVKILELKFLSSITHEQPILLLDDIFSELDSDYRSALSSVIHSQQTIITTADEKTIPSDIKSTANIIHCEEFFK